MKIKTGYKELGDLDVEFTSEGRARVVRGTAGAAQATERGSRAPLQPTGPSIGAATDQPRFRSKLEARRAQHLSLLQHAGEIVAVAHESVKLDLGTGRRGGISWYKPDFLIHDGQPRPIIEEVKGWMREDAAVKLKTAANLYSAFYRVRLVTEDRDTGQWVERWLA